MDDIERISNSKTIEDMEKTRDYLELKLASLKNQLDLATVDKDVDKEWKARTKVAERITGRNHQIILRMLGDAKKREKTKNHQEKDAKIERIFIRLIKQRLSDEELAETWDRAWQVYDAEFSDKPSDT